MQLDILWHIPYCGIGELTNTNNCNNTSTTSDYNRQSSVSCLESQEYFSKVVENLPFTHRAPSMERFDFLKTIRFPRAQINFKLFLKTSDVSLSQFNSLSGFFQNQTWRGSLTFKHHLISIWTEKKSSETQMNFLFN